MKIEYTNDTKGITPDMLEGFFVGWPDPPEPGMHLTLLRQSSHRVLALDPAEGRVIGFITAVSDGVLSAYIPLLEVVPGRQGEGIGQELVRRMLKELQDFYMVDLCCDAGLVPFYEQLGLHRVNGMVHRNYGRQSGKR
ncbi:GNAT family N-acetyltransferase [Edaphobacillus lindanitolerans]|uniref:Acetyltransferase (GNAT) domain-containing protein n=1 Tax=Edaphobacillus lindanitolerans TaxID=550447 RepID=A0A1U7PTT2_9BACI|nr:GNAT family N-acetyltransferase [Edaphobacillus lindanitolerans]SIT93457.1 Acetyltransferase (GNAT) domain-containing protein [Edaphobacillus lindanitolerans]